jgi:hypothetical protein
MSPRDHARSQRSTDSLNGGDPVPDPVGHGWSYAQRGRRLGRIPGSMASSLILGGNRPSGPAVDGGGSPVQVLRLGPRGSEGADAVCLRPLLAVGAENRVTLCDLQVLVDESAEPVSSEHADGGPGFWRGAACGRLLIQ